jgi:hypothetical protein
LPIGRDQVALIVQDLDVGDLVERDHIRLEPSSMARACFEEPACD